MAKKDCYRVSFLAILMALSHIKINIFWVALMQAVTPSREAEAKLMSLKRLRLFLTRALSQDCMGVFRHDSGAPGSVHQDSRVL